MSEQLFYVLSVKWSHRRDKLLTWWVPDDSGYTFRIDGTRKPAGLYTRAYIESNAMYYHNGTDTLAVPRDVVIAASMPLRDSASRFVDRTDLDDRVVTFGRMRAMKQAAKSWLAPVELVMR